MDKRLLIVLPLCLVILFGWQALSEKMGWTPPRTNARTAPATTPPSTPSTPSGETATGASSSAKPADETGPAPASLSPVVTDTEERREELTLGVRGQPGYYRAVFSNVGGVLEELATGNFFDAARLDAEQQERLEHWERLVSKLPGDAPRTFALRTAASTAAFAPTPLETALWTSRRIENGIEYSLSPGQGLSFKKRFRFDPAKHGLRFEFEIVNEARADAAGQKNFVLTAAAGVPRSSGDGFYLEPQAVAFSRARDGDDASLVYIEAQNIGEKRSDVLGTGSPLAFAGAMNKYFTVLLRGADDSSHASLVGASWRAFRAGTEAPDAPPSQLVTDVDLAVTIPAAGGSTTWTYDVYAGPKQREPLEGAYADHKVLLDHDLGYMRSLSKGLMWVMRGFHALTSSWGFAIILLTILVRVVLFPVNRRAQTAMARYQAKVKRIQPKIDEIKQRYKDDPAKLRQEQARLMQEGDALVPPLGGCLPPFLQIPVFFGLMSAIRIPFELRQEPFLGWIHDLSLPDRLITLAEPLPLVGRSINVLPPIMVVVWILQQRAMPKPTDEQAKMMYKMMLFMPIVMGVFLYNYAAGMSLYMITTSTLVILEQKVIKKYWPVDDTPIPKKKSGFMARLMQQAQEQQKRREADLKKRASARR